MYLHLLPGGGSSYYAQKQQTALYFVFYLMEAFSGMCFLFGFFLSFFFLKEVFGEVFFPWTCWPHVLNKSVLCWLIPVIWNVCFCVIWTSCFILLCSLLFLHVSACCHFCLHFCTLPNPFLKCNGLSVRCMQSVNESKVCTPFTSYTH